MERNVHVHLQKKCTYVITSLGIRLRRPRYVYQRPRPDIRTQRARAGPVAEHPPPPLGHNNEAPEGAFDDSELSDRTKPLGPPVNISAAAHVPHLGVVFHKRKLHRQLLRVLPLREPPRPS
eukprot:5766909-Pyramimonas_sp.AAC.4